MQTPASSVAMRLLQAETRPMNEMQVLGDVIRRGREQRGWNQRDLAGRLGWDNSRLSRIERGAMKELPTPEDMHALADVLGVPEARLLEAAGYRVADDDPPGDTLTLPAADPRAELVALLAGAPDDAVRTITATVRTLLPALAGARAPRGRAAG